jgi:hypothetical protein
MLENSPHVVIPVADMSLPARRRGPGWLHPG